MGKPSKVELELALAVAKQMREKGDDPAFVAKTLLNHHYRLTYLEHVMRAAELYLRSGLGEHEQSELLQAIESAHRADLHSAGADEEDLVL